MKHYIYTQLIKTVEPATTDELNKFAKLGWRLSQTLVTYSNGVPSYIYIFETTTIEDDTVE